MDTGTPDWVALAWRLPAGSSTPRVTTWRNLRRLGAARLTPGAALLPYREDLLEQLDWVSEEIENLGGEAWVLPVTALSESEERLVRERMAADRDEEYRALEEDARTFVARRAGQPVPDDDFAARRQIDKELLALQRRFRKVHARDYVGAAGRTPAARAIDRCLAYRQGISPKLLPMTDAELATPAEEEEEV
jgi:hypothetical protein